MFVSTIVGWVSDAPPTTARHPTRIIFALGATILISTGIATLLHVPGSIWVGTLARKDMVVALMLFSAAIWGAAVVLALKSPPKLAPILAIAIALRLVLLIAPPFMSSDIYRYVWDGRVQASGTNPYRYIAADPALATLRDATIYPRINRLDYAHTIYPPAAQLLFAAVGRIHPTVLGMKCAMLLLEACGIVAMLALLRRANLPLSRILIYAWNPLPAWAIALDGHVDGAMVGFLGLTLLATQEDSCSFLKKRTRKLLPVGVPDPIRIGSRTQMSKFLFFKKEQPLLFAFAILTKFFPLVLAPALWRRWDWKFPAATLATIAALYAVYASVGWRVFGFLPTYTQEEGLRAGPGFWLLGVLNHLTTLPNWAEPAYLAGAVVVLAALAIWIAFLQPQDNKEPVPLARNVALLAMVSTAAISPHYPWYYTWLALPACLVPWPSLLWLSAAPLFLYCDPWHDEILIPTAIFVPAAALTARDLWRARTLQAGA